MIAGPTGTGVVSGTSHVRGAPPLHRTPRALRCPTYTPIGRAPSDGALCLPTSRRPARAPRDVAFSAAEETVAVRAVERRSTARQRTAAAPTANQWSGGVIVLRVGRRRQIPRANAGQRPYAGGEAKVSSIVRILSGGCPLVGPSPVRTAPFASFERSLPAPHTVQAASPPSVRPPRGRPSFNASR